MLANSSTSQTAPIGTILDLDKLIFSPETASKYSSKHLKSHNGLTLGSQKIKVSSVNKKWVTIIASWYLEPTENPESPSLSTVADNIWLKASITNTKSKWDKGSPCHRPHELLKNPRRQPINDDREMDSCDTMSNPTLPSIPKTTSL